MHSRCRLSALAVTFVIALATLAVAKPPAEQPYVFAPFDPPGSILTFPIGVNNNGLITVQYLDANFTWHSATLKNRTYAIIDVPGAVGTLVSAPNMQGQVALAYWREDGAIHAALYTRGFHAFLPDVPGEVNTSPSAINARRQISGTTWSDNFYVVHGYVWDRTGYEVFDHPISDIPQTLAFAVNNRGQIVGQYTMANGEIHGFLRDRDGDRYTEIAFPGEPNTAAFGINNSGVIVGLCGVAGPGPNGFAVGSQGFVLRKGVYTRLVYPGSSSSFPLGINDTGDIVGVYTDENGVFHGYLATTRK